jgi:ATP-dependent Clp protease ATP-binding subunit ClpC
MGSSADHARSVIENALKKTFAPEFLNRIDDIIIFNSLEREDIHKIIDIELSHLHKRLEKLGYELEVTATAKDYIIEKGWDAQFGARPLKRAIQKYIEDVLAEEIIKNVLQAGDRIYVDHEEGKDDMTIDIRKGTPLPANAAGPEDN